MILQARPGREGLRKGTLFFYLIPATVVAFRVAVVIEVQFAQPSHTPGDGSALGIDTISALQQFWQPTGVTIRTIGRFCLFFHPSLRPLSKI